jgi:hypothetical protein
MWENGPSGRSRTTRNTTALIVVNTMPAIDSGLRIKCTVWTMPASFDKVGVSLISDEPRQEPCEEIAVVQAFRPAVSGGPEGPHYIRSDFFTGSMTRPRLSLRVSVPMRCSRLQGTDAERTAG